MDTRVLPDPAAVAIAAAEQIAAWIRDDVAARQTCTIAFSGGSTPGPLLKHLAGLDLPWAAVSVFQVDERVAEDGDDDRNLALLADTIAKVATVYPMPVTAANTGQPAGPAQLAQQAGVYADLLTGAAGRPAVLDIVHLGLGPDGHTASLVPGDPVLDVNDADIALTQPYQGRVRMTMTYPLLRRARRLVWQIVGADKAKALRTLHAGGAIPAAGLPSDAAVAFVDRAAAGRTDA